jgi:hypothetical protein
MVKTFEQRKLSVGSLEKRKAELVRAMSTPAGMIRASLVTQYLTCGKSNCRCRRGFKHGPFFYLVQCLGTGRVRKFLLKTPAQRKQARAGIAAHLKMQRRLAELSEINTEILRRDAAGKGRA